MTLTFNWQTDSHAPVTVSLGGEESHESVRIVRGWHEATRSFVRMVPDATHVSFSKTMKVLLEDMPDTSVTVTEQ